MPLEIYTRVVAGRLQKNIRLVLGALRRDNSPPLPNGQPVSGTASGHRRIGLEQPRIKIASLAIDIPPFLAIVAKNRPNTPCFGFKSTL